MGGNGQGSANRSLHILQVMTLWDMLFADEWCQRHSHKACNISSSSSSNTLVGADCNQAADATSSTTSSKQQEKGSTTNSSSSRQQMPDRSSVHGSSAQLGPGMVSPFDACAVLTPDETSLWRGLGPHTGYNGMQEGADLGGAAEIKFLF